MNRRLLLVNLAAQSWRLETLNTETLDKDSREDYFVLSGEALCQYLLRRDHDALVIARGPMPFLSGNKASVGYVSPLTGVPHYSFVGGRAAAQLLNLGLDAVCLQDEQAGLPLSHYVVVSGRAPNLAVEFKSAADLPTGQRSAYYWLLERELGGDAYAGSIFTVGEGARLGYRSANLAVEAIYHAGRGGAGVVFARFASALVLRGEPMELAEFFIADDSPFARSPNAIIAPLLDEHCARLSGKTGGTIAKLYATGADPEGKNTLPARNAQRLGYQLADLGGPQVLKATRQGQTGCHWCQVDCRHYHWVDVDYAPSGRDLFLDDFEPTYAIFAMLGLEPAEDSLQGRLDLLAEVDRRLILPIEQMGCDIINVGIGLAALFEGIECGLIPAKDLPPCPSAASPPVGGTEGGQRRLETAIQAVEMLRSGQALEYPALRAVGDGPQALADLYPAMQDIVFTGGKGTLGNAGHANALWSFLMPFSRFFSHYSGQIYKIDETLPPPGSDEAAYRACFQRVVQRMLQKEFFWVLCNALSMCAFTFVIFSQDGKGEQLSDDDGRSSSASLIRLLRNYGIRTTRADLEWFAQALWAQSIDLKCQFGWQPPAAVDFPRRVYEALSQALERSPEELQSLMGMLIEEWKRQAGEVLERFGYEAAWRNIKG
jgi:aldehyde:ferredoxin oxidoreductase